jgi:flagellin-like protein
MNKRGVSPVIATVLLIGIVIVIGLIIFLWLRGLTQEAVFKFDQNIELTCNDVKFSSSYSSGTLTISNTGNVAIYDIE